MTILFTNWQIITGGPSSGKTTTLNGIASLGYKTVPELARVYIDEEMSKGRTVQEIRSSELEFQEKVLGMKNEIEYRLNPNELIFFDRGIWDSIPYMKLAGASKESIKKINSKHTYNNIFLLEQVPFNTDYARVESAEKAISISELLFIAYSEKGYNVIKVPIMPVSNRVDFILNKLNIEKQKSHTKKI